MLGGTLDNNKRGYILAITMKSLSRNCNNDDNVKFYTDAVSVSFTGHENRPRHFAGATCASMSTTTPFCTLVDVFSPNEVSS